MKVDLKRIANPYSAFAISWFLCLFLYWLGWSDMFPVISKSLIIFLGISILAFACTGLTFNRIQFKPPVLLKKISPVKLLIIDAVLYLLNFMYSGIPLLKGTRIDDFGIPTLIVIVTTLNSFLSVYFFYNFLLSNRKIFFVYILVCFSLFMMAFSRGNIMMSMVTMFFLWININLPKLNFKKFTGILSGVILVMYIFGVAGNYRTINDIRSQEESFDQTYNSNVILSLGGASDGFKNNLVPDEFFWTYLYVTSPLSNLQYNIDKNSPPFTLKGVFYILIDELTFDTVSKRINNVLGRKHVEPDLVVPQLTVSATLTESYDYAGWGGMTVFMLAFWIFPFIYSLCVLHNPLAIIGVSTLCTVYFFSIFDNMFILTGLTFQIFYPIVFNLFENYNTKNIDE